MTNAARSRDREPKRPEKHLTVAPERLIERRADPQHPGKLTVGRGWRLSPPTRTARREPPPPNPRSPEAPGLDRSPPQPSIRKKVRRCYHRHSTNTRR